MPDEKMTGTSLPTMSVTVVGGTGNGLVGGTLAKTPADQPNLRINIVQPVVAIAVRGGYLFLTTLVGLLVAGMTPAGGRLLYTSDFYHLVLTCANLSLPVAGLGFLKDLVTILGKLENKYPLLSGGV